MIGLSPNFIMLSVAYRQDGEVKVFSQPERSFTAGTIPVIGTLVGVGHFFTAVADIVYGLVITLFRQVDGWRLVSKGLTSLMIAPIEVVPGMNICLIIYYRTVHALYKSRLLNSACRENAVEIYLDEERITRQYFYELSKHTIGCVSLNKNIFQQALDKIRIGDQLSANLPPPERA